MADGPTRGMLDTSTVLLLGEITDPTSLPDESVISAITLAELSVGPHVARDDEERAARQQHLQQAEADFEVLPFDAECARAFGGVAAALRASGRKPAARSYDALIAASAIAHGVALYTCHPHDFNGIPRLQLRPIANQ
jgi:tRNA(fMet)-specific endonuclease VapC